MTSPPAESDLTGALRALRESVADVVALTSTRPSRISVSMGDVKIEAEWPTADQVVVATTAAVPVPADVPAVTAVAANVLRAPLVGSFFRAPGPGAAPFAEVGDVVKKGDQIGIVEAMKLMNPIIAEQGGRITEFLVDDGEPVEFDQPLLAFEPEGDQ